MTAFKQRMVLWLTAAFTVACALALSVGSVALAADSSVNLGEPLHTKTLVANGDGTYDLTLDVTGKSQASSEKTKANVVVIVDTSGSMAKTDTGKYVQAASDDDGTKYGLVNGRYVELSKYGNYYYYNGSRYTGTLYVQATRMSVAQDAVNDLAAELLKANTGEDADIVELALVTFSNVADIKTLSTDEWTTDYDSFSNAVNNLNADGGTNWEDALAKANSIEGDGDPTYVIFVSDGNPTFRETRGNYSNLDTNQSYYNQYGVYGTGSDSNETTVERCYEQAKDDAKAIVDAPNPKNFYAIGAFGNVDRMQSLLTYAYNNDAPDGHYFSVSDQAALEAAFASIVADINKNFTYADVTITDEVTDLVATGIEGTASDFVYKKNGEVWADAPEASFADGTVTWNLGENFKLEDGVTYSVSFKVWPNQEAYDLIAGLTNGTIEWDASKYPNVVKNEDGSYSVHSNESAVLSYKQVDSVNGEETKGETQYADYTRPIMPVPVSTLEIVKAWENAPAGFAAPSIEVAVTMDGEDYQTVTLNAANKWTENLIVAAGPEGHTYGIQEITDLGNGWTTTYGETSALLKGITALSASFSLTNTYKAAPATVAGEDTINVQKILVGRDWKNSDEFQFELTPVTEGAPMPENTSVTAKNDTPLAFGDITFTEAGTYVYQVTETEGSIPGVSYDQTIRTVVVEVVDNGKGQLVATINYGSPELNAAIFTNYYGAEAVDLILAATKVLKGRDWFSTDEFTFVLASQDDAPASSDAEISANKDNQTVSFGEITFDKPGDYEFVMTETAGEIPGITYSDEVYTVLVSVVDDTEGHLKVANLVYKTSDGSVFSGASFTNVYSADPVTVGPNGEASIEVSKSLTGRDWAAGDVFTAVIAAKTDGAPMPEDNTVDLTEQNMTGVFEDIVFDKTGTYVYTVSETKGSLGGVTYDTAVFEVTVEVTDNGEGELEAAVSYGDADAIEFVNTYEADEVTLEGETALKVQKVLEGREWIEGDEFSFTISGADGAPMPADKKVTVTDGAVADFGAITFTEAGTYTYTISEDLGILGGIIYDENEWVVTVTVTDNGKGQLEAVVDYGVADATAAVFTNIYGAEDVSLSVEASKVLAGRDWAEGDAFEFVLSAVDGAPMPESNIVTAYGPETVSFDEITFDEVGEYVYAVSEKAGSIEGVTYDGQVYTATVKVEDDKKGNLFANVVYTDEEGETVNGAVFTNEYTADAATATLKAEKVLEGREWMAGDEFQFVLTAVDGAPMPESATVLAKGPEAVSFGNIVFDEAGTYNYTISEVKGDLGGVAYDDTVYDVTVTVTDNGKGELVAEVSYGEGVEIPVFTNVYSAEEVSLEGEGALKAQKVLEGRDWKDTDSFEFTLEATDGAPMPEGDSNVVVATNGEPVSFGDITFTEAGTYVYTVTETKGDLGGITYDETVRTVTVVVTDNKKGQLEVSVDYGTPEAEAAIFTNIYGAEKVTLEGDTALQATKVLEGREWFDSDEFTFVLAAKDGAPESADSEVVVKEGSQTGVFGKIVFTEAGTYEYTISEVAGEIPGVTYDDAVYTVVVTVVDNTEGQLVATVDYKNAEGDVVSGASFTNVYNAESVTVGGKTALEASKILEGRDWTVEDEFEFVLTPKGDAPASEQAKAVADMDNQTVSFGDIVFTEVGTYEYTIVETAGSLGGVTYDEAAYNVTITVTDDGEGHLVADVVYTDEEGRTVDGAVFTNVYEADDVTLQGETALKVQKVLEGREWIEGDEFSFTISAKTDGAPMPADKKVTVTNGDVTDFGAITFTEAGTYVYGISEDLGILGGILYDEQVYTVTVEVTDDGVGQLHASVDYGIAGATAAVFTNVYGAEDVSLSVEASKVLTGRDWAEGDAFEFVLSAVDGAPMPESNAVTVYGPESVSFDEIAFDEVGEYVYTISETKGSIEGVTYDDQIYTATIKVDDDKKGNLFASVVYTDEEGETVNGAVFTNEYNADSVIVGPKGDVALQAKKVLEGREWMAGDAFQFVLTAVDGAPMPESATVLAKGPEAVSFGNIVFDEVGTYEYTIAEVAGEIGGVTYDETVYNATVVVTDNGKGKLVAEVFYDEGVEIPVFTNVYEAEDVSLKGDGALKVQKVLVGRDWKDTDEFQFELSPVTEGAPMPETTVVTAKNDTPLAFGDITFTEAGTYVYQVTEVEGSIPGVSYDQTIRTVVVTVTDNKKGQLEVSVNYGVPELNAAVFTNFYGAKAVDLILAATKIFEGREWTSEDEFEFVLTPKGDAPASSDAEVSANKNNQTVSFGEITFDTPGDYEFVMTETKGDIAGVTYSEEVFTVLVSVVDDTEGSLKVANLAYKASDGSVFSGASFKNVYKTENVVVGGETALQATKQLEGRDWVDSDEFEFVLTPKGDAPASEQAKVVANKDNQTVSFGDIVFDKVGTYEYVIAETAGSIGGVAYDEAAYNVTIEVTDDGKGHLVADVTYADEEGKSVDGAVFTNVYEADDVTLQGETALKGQKVLEGREWLEDDEFTFAISSNTDGAPMPEDKKVTVTNGDVTGFGAITFTEAGVYTYTISEDLGILGGIIYDEEDWTVTVTVTDDGVGQLHASVDYGIAGATAAVFTNVYGADEVTISGEAGIQASKVLTGRDWAEGDSFEFVLAAQTEGAPMPETNTVTAYGPEAVAFGAITFDEVGEYVYTVTEKPGSIEGVTYDDQVYTVTIKVEDDKKGNLFANVAYADQDGQDVNGAVFTNKYAADPVTVGPKGDVALQAQKVIDGREWLEDDEFAFTLNAVDGAPMPEVATVTVNGPEVVSFDNIVFNKVGTYEYAISEVKGSIGGIAYDETVYGATVTVTDNGKGKLVAEVSYDEGVEIPVFTNVYDVAGAAGVDTVDFGLTKKLTGRDWAEGDSFEFQISAVTEGAPMPESTTATVTENGGAIDFGSIVYDAAELKGQLPATFEYEISEVIPEETNGIAYDAHKVTVSVTVKDQKDGTISAAATIAGEKVFTNVYDVVPSELPFTVQKTLNGRDMAEGQFEFNVEPADEASAEKLAAATVTNPAAADGEIAVMALSNLKFALADAGKTFTYEVSEVQADAEGYTYDSKKHTVEFVVADTGKGMLDVIIKVDGEESETAVVNFVNNYDASGVLGGEGSVSIEATKTLEGQALSAGEFTFAVLDAQGNQVATGTNDADGVIAFDAIEYSIDSAKADVEAGLAVKNADGTYAYTYQVVENTEGLGEVGITPTVSSFGIVVTLTDNGDGTLTPAVTYPEGTESLEFVNQYGTNEAQLVFTGTKVVVADEGLNPPDVEGKFTFTLMGKNADGMTATNDAAGNITFDAITYTTADLADVQPDENNVRTAVFEYSVEESGVVEGIVNDAGKTFTVTLTDDGKGNLTATPDGNANFVFNNVYNVTVEVSNVLGQINMTKVLEGREMVEGEFEFEMKDANGEVVADGHNMADGTVIMDEISFSKPGTYVYSVSEVAGDKGGVTYDTTVYTVVANVVDNSDGTMSVEWTIEGAEEMVFENFYEAAPTAIQFGALKTIEGRDLTAGEFTFELTNEGELMSTATNDAEGAVTFEPIAFEEEGTYLFEISEVAGNAAGVTYDDTVYEVQVVVTDDLNGNLQPEVEFLNGDPVFVNTYTEPTVPTNPDGSGDNGGVAFAQTNDSAPFAAVVAVACVAAAAVVVAKRRMVR